jgi:hypothetical protein
MEIDPKILEPKSLAELSPEELAERRKTKYIIDPKDVLPKEELRVRQWGAAMMKKHEHLLNSQVTDRHIVASDGVKPEDVDMRLIYPFPDLNWLIYRNGQYWSLMLRSGTKILAVMTYAKI